MQEQNELTELKELTDLAYESLKKEREENARNSKKENEALIRMLERDRLFIQAAHKEVESQSERVQRIYEEIVSPNNSSLKN